MDKNYYKSHLQDLKAKKQALNTSKKNIEKQATELKIKQLQDKKSGLK
jgi:hypothetical protein